MNSKINYAVAICEPLELEHPDSFLDVQVPYPQALPHDVIVKVQVTLPIRVRDVEKLKITKLQF